jgi:putative ABC transport system permease protein
VTFLKFLPYVSRTVRRAPVRSGLTVAGTALALAIFAFVRTLETGVSDFERSAAQPVLVVFQQSRFCPLTSELPGRYRAVIDAMPGVAATLPTTIFVNQCQSNLDLVTLHGVDPATLDDVHDLRVLSGDAAAWKGDRNGALVGARLAARRGVGVGDRVRLADMDVTVRAVVDGAGAGLDNVAFVHEPTLQVKRKMVGRSTEILVRMEPGADADALARAIDARFASDEAPTDTKTMQAFVQGAIGEVTGIVRFARLLGYLAVLVVTLVLSNTVFISAQTRAQELGTLEAIGLGKARLAGLVLAEGVLLALVGGAVGTGAVMAFFHLVPTTLGVEGFGIDFRGGMPVLWAGLVASLVVGVVASVPPAVEAVLRPVVRALRPT